MILQEFITLGMAWNGVWGVFLLYQSGATHLVFCVILLRHNLFSNKFNLVFRGIIMLELLYIHEVSLWDHKTFPFCGKHTRTTDKEVSLLKTENIEDKIVCLCLSEYTVIPL